MGSMSCRGAVPRMGPEQMTTTSPLSEALEDRVEVAATVDWPALPAETQDATRRLVFDALGVASAGRYAPGVDAAIGALAGAVGPGDVQVPWMDLSLPVTDAAMTLSWLIHAWDFDDTHDAGVLHAGALAVAAAYATAVKESASGQRFLEGTVAGVETVARLSLALGFQRGVIRSSGLACLGAAAAAARVLGLGPGPTRSALALATPFGMSPTSRQVLVDGGETKRLQPGFGVRDGVTCAYLAKAGIRGPQGWFSGEFGLGALAQDEAATLAALDYQGWEIDRLSIKPYPSCRFTHASISAAFSIRSAGITAEEIEEIEISVPAGPSHATVGRPWARRSTPLNDRQFSIPWMVAAALTYGRADLGVVTGQSVLDAGVEALAGRVSVRRDVEPDDSGITPVRMLVRNRDGSEQVTVIRSAPGSGRHPLGWEPMTGKIAGCLRAAGLAAGRAEDAAERLQTAVRQLGKESITEGFVPVLATVPERAV
jgi:2-methylcitrate dehydratase PrpD